MNHLVSTFFIVCLLLTACSQEGPSRPDQSSATANTSSANQRWKALFKITSVESPSLASLDQIDLEKDPFTETQKQYVKALRAMAANDVSKASDLFLTIPPGELPPGFLYPPYRAVSAAKPERENPFREPLLTLAENGKLPSLWEARLLRDEGRFLDALTAYWRSAPAEWTMHDVDCLVQIATLQGAKPDVHSLVRKALATKQLTPPVEKAIHSELSEKYKPMSSTAMEERLEIIQQEMDGQTASGKAIVESIKKSLNLRASFLQKDYKGVMAQTRDKDPIRQSDETLMITFLSASQLLEVKEATRWGQEIMRRNNGNETKTWVATIIEEAKTTAQASSSSSPASAPSF